MLRVGAPTWPLERELDDRDPPGKVGRVTCDDTLHKQIKTSAKAKLRADHTDMHTHTQPLFMYSP